MKIAKAFVYTLDLPVNADVDSIVVGPFDGGESYLDVVVKLVTDTGICGYGEVSVSCDAIFTKVMFSQVSVCPQEGGVHSTPADGMHSPLGRHPPS